MCLFPTARIKRTGQARRCGVGGGSPGLQWGLALHVMELQWIPTLLWTGEVGLSFSSLLAVQMPQHRTQSISRSTEGKWGNTYSGALLSVTGGRLVAQAVGNQKSGSWIQRTSGRLCLIAVSLAANRFDGGWAAEMVSSRAAQAGRDSRSCPVAR